MLDLTSDSSATKPKDKPISRLNFQAWSKTQQNCKSSGYRLRSATKILRGLP